MRPDQKINFSFRSHFFNLIIEEKETLRFKIIFSDYKELVLIFQRFGFPIPSKVESKVEKDAEYELYCFSFEGYETVCKAMAAFSKSEYFSHLKDPKEYMSHSEMNSELSKLNTLVEQGAGYLQVKEWRPHRHPQLPPSFRKAMRTLCLLAKSKKNRTDPGEPTLSA